MSTFEMHVEHAPTVSVEPGYMAGTVELSVSNGFLTLTGDEAKQLAKALKNTANTTTVVTG